MPRERAQHSDPRRVGPRGQAQQREHRERVRSSRAHTRRSECKSRRAQSPTAGRTEPWWAPLGPTHRAVPHTSSHAPWGPVRLVPVSSWRKPRRPRGWRALGGQSQPGGRREDRRATSIPQDPLRCSRHSPASVTHGRACGPTYRPPSLPAARASLRDICRAWHSGAETRMLGMQVRQAERSLHGNKKQEEGWVGMCPDFLEYA